MCLGIRFIQHVDSNQTLYTTNACYAILCYALLQEMQSYTTASSKSFSRPPGCLVVNHNSFMPQLSISAPIILDSASILPPFNTLCSKHKNLILNKPQAKGLDPINAQYWQASRLIMASRAASGLDFHSACACSHILKCFK